MKTPEILSKMMKNRKFECPNLFEQRVDSLSDRLYFTGDGTVIFYLKSLDRNKNPDFIVLPTGMNPEDVDADFLATYKPKKVVEAFGNYWHGPKITGMSRKRHEQELVDAYAEEGIECLVIWEGKISQKDLDLFL